MASSPLEAYPLTQDQKGDLPSSSSSVIMALPQATVAILPPSQAQPASGFSSNRRLPPPCWTQEETDALIDAYCEKWYALRRGNLRAAHWQEVADAVSARCPHASPPKTAVQCRHKMEKLRKRYRAELQRAQSIPHHNFSSSWVHFPKMIAMEKGTSATVSSPETAADEEESDGVDPHDDEDQVEESDYGNRIGMSRNYDPIRGYNREFQRSINNGDSANGIRIRIQGNSISRSGIKGMNLGKFEENPNPNPNPNPKPNPRLGYKSRYDFGRSDSDQDGVQVSKKSRTERGSRMSLGKRERGGDAVAELAEAVRALGEGFVRMEKMKVEMMREMERMRMEMEMKRTQTILESQHRIVEAFVKGLKETRVKKGRAPSPES